MADVPAAADHSATTIFASVHRTVSPKTITAIVGAVDSVDLEDLAVVVLVALE